MSPGMPNGGGFHYTRFPEKGSVPEGDENYYRQVYYHKLGTDWHGDPKVFGEGRPKEEWPRIQASSNYEYLLLTVERGWSAEDLYIRRVDEPVWRPVVTGLPILIKGDVFGGRLFLLTNHQAPRYRVVATDPAAPAPEHWQDVIPEQKGVIQEMRIVGGKLIVHMMENAYSRLYVYETDGRLVTEIELPALGSVADIRGRYDSNELFFKFESFTYLPTVFRYDLGIHQMTVVDRMELALDLERYETKQVWFNSKDGTRVPMFVISRKGLALNGDNPTVLYGYGGFNINITPSFIQHPIPFIDAGGVYALANLRGGGEFGEDWHRAGQLEKKQNVFDDMIAACEKLIADKYTRPRRLGLRGGSNGGLLLGAMITQRPDLFSGGGLCRAAARHGSLSSLLDRAFVDSGIWFGRGCGAVQVSACLFAVSSRAGGGEVSGGVVYDGGVGFAGGSDARVQDDGAVAVSDGSGQSDFVVGGEESRARQGQAVAHADPRLCR